MRRFLMTPAMAMMAALACGAALIGSGPALAQDAHAGHAMHGLSAQEDTAAQEDTGSTTDDTAAGSDGAHAAQSAAMPKKADAPVPKGAPPAAAFTGPEHAADLYYPDGAMEASRHAVTHDMGGMHTTLVLLDRLEVQPTGHAAIGVWDAALRSGSDTDRLWITSQGEGTFGDGVDDADIEALWGHAIGPWFDVQAGVRHQFGPDPDRTQAVIGVQGLAPYMFELSAQAFLSTQGEATARIEAETDQRLTQRLIVQPRIELNLSAQTIAQRATGRGLTSLETGLRLRYEVLREFAPYVGVEWQRQFGKTARFARAAGDDPDRLIAVFGVKAWF